MNETGIWISWEMNFGPESSCLFCKLKLGLLNLANLMNVNEYRMNETGNWILWEMNIGPESSCLCYKLKLNLWDECKWIQNEWNRELNIMRNEYWSRI